MRNQNKSTAESWWNSLNTGLLSVIVVATGLITNPVSAEDEVIEEILVTATKRGNTSVMDTPVTVNVVTGDDLKFREIRNPEDLRTAVSGLYVDEGSSSPKIAIRGVGYDNFQVQAENGVTTYVDGVVIQRAQAVLGGFLDLAQVEVLKGPQGSAFGRNATGGAINLITTKPQQGFEGEISGGFGSFDRRNFAGVLNYGGDQFGVRVAVSHEEDDGFIDNLVTGSDDIGSKEQTMARIALSFAPTDSVSIDYSYSLTDSEFIGPGQDYTTATASAIAAGTGLFFGLTPLATPLTGLIDDNYNIVNRMDPLTDVDMDMHALTVEFDLGWATLKSITGYVDFENKWISDVAFPSAFAEGLISVDFSKIDSEQFSQELLLSGSSESFNWVVGAYYLTEEAENDGEFTLSIAPPLPPGTAFVTQNGQDLTSYAVFADGQIKLNDQWRLNAGVRYTEDEKDATGRQRFGRLPIGVEFPLGLPTLDGVDTSDDSVTWQAGLEWDVSEELFAFFRIAEGFKGGGINNATATLYEPEELLSYEIGLKGETDQFTFSVAAFHSDYENIQLFINSPANPGSADIINAAEATIAGFDFDAEWRATEALSFDLRATWLTEAEYDSFVAVDGVIGMAVDFSGDPLNRSPDFTGVFGVNLDFALSGNVQLRARAEVYKTSEIVFSFLDRNRPNGALSQDGYELYNVYVTATINDQFDIRAYGRNIGDEFYLSTSAEGGPGFQYGQHGRPEEYGLEVTYRF